MGIPVATTTITVLRLPTEDLYAEPYNGQDASARQAVATGVRAVIDRPSGRDQVAGGEQERVDLELICDEVGLDYLDQVRDDSTGRVYDVVYAIAFHGDHEEAALRIVRGET